MHLTAKTAVLSFGLAASLSLAGCAQSDRAVIPTAVSSSATVFKSDADALAAAKKAYLAYLAVSDQILVDGGANSKRLLTVATPEELKAQIPGFSEFQTNKWHGAGRTTIESFRLEGFFPTQREGIVSAYVCVDVSGVNVLDAAGSSVVSATRPSLQPFEATFDLKTRNSKTLVVASQKPWTSGGVC